MLPDRGMAARVWLEGRLRAAPLLSMRPEGGAGSEGDPRCSGHTSPSISPGLGPQAPPRPGTQPSQRRRSATRTGTHHSLFPSYFSSMPAVGQSFVF